MGRYDFRPARVHQTASRLLATRRMDVPPPWYYAIGAIPPAAILTRPQAIPHQRRAKRSKMFKPQQLTYPEDQLRREFFEHHPWELARPRVVTEDDGKDARGWEWDSIAPKGRPLNGESVVQRQMWLMEKDGLSKQDAYDQARREFYELRTLEDVERYVAKEEAWATGAYFGKGPVQVGAELEDEAFERWRDWLSRTATESERARDVMNTGTGLPQASQGRGEEDAEEKDEDALSDMLETEGVAQEESRR